MPTTVDSIISMEKVRAMQTYRKMRDLKDHVPPAAVRGSVVAQQLLRRRNEKIEEMEAKYPDFKEIYDNWKKGL